MNKLVLEISKAEFDIPSLCGMQTGRKRLLQHFFGAALIRPVRELEVTHWAIDGRCGLGAARSFVITEAAGNKL